MTLKIILAAPVLAVADAFERHFVGMIMPITWQNVTTRAHSINRAARNH